MTREEVFERLNKIFQDIFDDENIVVNDSTTANDIDGWDSLEQVNLIVEIENEFGIKFNIKQVDEMKNVGDMVNAILLN